MSFAGLSYDPKDEVRNRHADLFGGSKLASIMVPTRGRGRELLESLESLYSRASNPSLIEALIKIDTDDVESYLPFLEDIKKVTHGNYKMIISDRLDGYWALQHAWNDLAAVAEGEYLFLWNDDVLMDTKDWDVTLGLYKGKICVIELATSAGPENSSFPVIHSSIPKQTGYLSPSPFNDNYIHDISALLGIQVREHRISVTHRGWTDSHYDDATHAEGSATSMASGDERNKHWLAYETTIRPIILPQNVSVIRKHIEKHPDLYVSVDNGEFVMVNGQLHVAQTPSA